LSSSRRENEASLIEQQNEEFLLPDKFTSFQDLIIALSDEFQRKDFITKLVRD